MNTSQQAFTFVEVLVVIGLILAVLLGTIQGLIGYARYQALVSARTDVYMVLQEVRAAAVASEGAVPHGLHFAGNTVTTFATSSYATNESTNRERLFPGITFTADLSNGSSELIFKQITGQPSATGTIVLETVDGNASTTISISSTGLIQ